MERDEHLETSPNSSRAGGEITDLVVEIRQMLVEAIAVRHEGS